MTTEEPRGARAHAIPLPDARRLRRALDSLDTGIGVHRGAGGNPMGERGDAAQMLGILKAQVTQVEDGLRGGPLQTDVQKGWLAGYERDVPAIFSSHAAQVRDLAQFAQEGIARVPNASQQLSVASAALLTAHHALAAAAEIAVGIDAPDLDGEEIVRQSEDMYAAADLLAGYVTQKRAKD